ncbi:Cytochrome P450 [Tolypocladium paradoxum]|uniref:Cytochrome P450 n=1 Tax=Tolypocladium paradoxum TaxID=94208 RepID=A0A2S4L8D3_9HYPO|nr:Cytochrome P450 [Tolypocladium paradoxum]
MAGKSFRPLGACANTRRVVVDTASGGGPCDGAHPSPSRRASGQPRPIPRDTYNQCVGEQGEPDVDVPPHPRLPSTSTSRVPTRRNNNNIAIALAFKPSDNNGGAAAAVRGDCLGGRRAARGCVQCAVAELPPVRVHDAVARAAHALGTLDDVCVPSLRVAAAPSASAQGEPLAPWARPEARERVQRRGGEGMVSRAFASLPARLRFIVLASRANAPLRITELEHDGLIRYLFFLNRERIVVASPKALAEVLVTKAYIFKKPDTVRNTLGRVLGYGILLAEGDEHKVQRKNLMPAFAFRRLKGLYPTFWTKAREVTLAMTAACGDATTTVLEVNGWASRCTLDIIGMAGMGVEFGAIQDENNPLAQTYTRLSNPSRQAKVLIILGMFMPGWLLNHLPVKRNGDIKAAAQRIRSVCRDLIREKKQRMANKEPTDLDILSVALESGLFTDEQLVDQLMTFLAAGHETTASALTWSVYQLSRHPEKQQRLRDEVRAMLPSIDDEGGEISSADVDRMPYLHAVCNEVLRTYSPVPQTIREAAVDTTLQGQFVPRGTRIIVSPWGTNVDRSLWGDDAGEFRPERWLAAASGGAESNYAFLTFLHGPRSCIGAAFARAEVACLLAAWVGRFEFALDDEALMDERNLQFKPSITARPKHGMHIRTKVVEGW